MSAFQNGKFGPQPKEAKEPGATSSDKKTDWTLQRKSTSKVILYSKEPGQSQPNEDVGLVFERYGFADWKLTEVRLKKLQ